MGTFVLPNGQIFHPIDKLNCDTEGVVYLMLCKCGSFYVRETKCHFHKRIHDHVYAVRNGKTMTPISIHMGFKHNDSTMMIFLVLEKVKKNPSSGNWEHSILKTRD